MEKETPQAQVEEETLKIKIKIQAKIKHKVKGMTSLKFNVIIAKTMGIIRMNVKRNNMILVNKMKVLERKIKMKTICSYLAM